MLLRGGSVLHACAAGVVLVRVAVGGWAWVVGCEWDVDVGGWV